MIHKPVTLDSQMPIGSGNVKPVEVSSQRFFVFSSYGGRRGLEVLVDILVVMRL